MGNHVREKGHQEHHHSGHAHGAGCACGIRKETDSHGHTHGAGTAHAHTCTGHAGCSCPNCGGGSAKKELQEMMIPVEEFEEEIIAGHGPQIGPLKQVQVPSVQKVSRQRFRFVLRKG